MYRYTLSIGAKTNDFGWPWTAIRHSTAQSMRISEPATRLWMKIDTYYQRQKCSLGTLVSGNIKQCRYSWRSLARGVKRQWGVGNGDFQYFQCYIFGTFRCKANIITPSPEKRAYSIICVTLTNLHIFSQFLVQNILGLHFTKALENLPH